MPLSDWTFTGRLVNTRVTKSLIIRHRLTGAAGFELPEGLFDCAPLREYVARRRQLRW